MAQLVINTSDSYCGSCRKPASMYESGHYTILGWVENGSEGCGAVWDSVTSDYLDISRHLAEPNPGGFGFAENLRGLPVYSFFQDEPIGVYGGTAEQNSTLF